jgi:lactococcin 972 family bacteriocin
MWAMNRTTKIIASAVLALGLVAGSTVAANAQGIEPGEVGSTRIGNGSFWQWGVSDGRTWSNYFHEGQCHGATAIGKERKRVTNVPAGLYAYASTPKKASGNEAYYHVC